AERSGGNAAHENLPERQPVETRRVQRLPRTFEPKIIERALRAICGNENVLDDDVPASGRLQARHVPGVDARIVLAREEKDAPLGRFAVAARDERPEQRPVAMDAAARITPTPAQAMAAGNGARAAGGHERGADQTRGVLAPNLLRRAVVEQRHEPGMHA